MKTIKLQFLNSIMLIFLFALICLLCPLFFIMGIVMPYKFKKILFKIIDNLHFISWLYEISEIVKEH
jgi:hypothetical protein